MLRLRLLLFQKVDNESLIFHDEVIRETLRPQIVAEVVSPLRVERLKNSELRRRSGTGAVDAVGRRSPKWPGPISTRRFGRRRRGGMPMSSKNAPKQAVLVATRCCASCHSSERRRLGRFAGILFPLVHFLFELLGFLLVDEGESCHTIL